MAARAAKPTVGTRVDILNMPSSTDGSKAVLSEYPTRVRSKPPKPDAAA